MGQPLQSAWSAIDRQRFHCTQLGDPSVVQRLQQRRQQRAASPAPLPTPAVLSSGVQRSGSVPDLLGQHGTVCNMVTNTQTDERQTATLEQHHTVRERRTTSLVRC